MPEPLTQAPQALITELPAGFMGQLWAGRRSMVDMLLDIGPGKSLGYRMEAGRQLGYQRLRTLRGRFLNRCPAPSSGKLGKKLGSATSQ